MNLASFNEGGLRVQSYRELYERKRGKVTVKGNYDVKTKRDLFSMFSFVCVFLDTCSKDSRLSLCIISIWQLCHIHQQVPCSHQSLHHAFMWSKLWASHTQVGPTGVSFVNHRSLEDRNHGLDNTSMVVVFLYIYI